MRHDPITLFDVVAGVIDEIKREKKKKEESKTSESIRGWKENNEIDSFEFEMEGSVWTTAQWSRCRADERTDSNALARTNNARATHRTLRTRKTWNYYHHPPSIREQRINQRGVLSYLSELGYDIIGGESIDPFIFYLSCFHLLNRSFSNYTKNFLFRWNNFWKVETDAEFAAEEGNIEFRFDLVLTLRCCCCRMYIWTRIRSELRK